MSLARHLSALEDALADLDRATADRGKDRTWAATRTVLGWLYETEEAAKKLMSDYYDVREQSEAGHTLAGLIYVRGLAVHHQAEVREVWKAAPTYLRVDGGWKEVEPKVRREGAWHPAAMRIWQVHWPPLADLPRPGRQEAHGRDHLYEKNVAGQPIAEPLRVAQAFLASLACTSRDDPTRTQSGPRRPRH